MEKKSAPVTIEKSRRSFLNRIWIILGIAAFVELLWVIGAYLLPRKGRPQTNGDFGTEISVGKVNRFQNGSVTAFPRGQFYLVRLESGGFIAVSRRCTHLGCTVPWVEKEKKFICPCHASIYSLAGDVVRSPAPRALDLFKVRIENDTIFVDTITPIRRSAFKEEQVVYPA